jgi:hypothetical protein
MSYIPMSWKSKTPQSVSQLLHIEIGYGKLTTQHYDKRDYFNFSIVTFPYLCGNIPCNVIISCMQLIQYARACSIYDQFLIRSTLQTD